MTVLDALRDRVAAPLYHGSRERAAMARALQRNGVPDVDASPRRLLDLWRRGFLPGAAGLYDFDAHDHDEYLSARQHFRTGDINGHWGRLVENKLAAHWLLASAPDRRQRVDGLLVDGRGYETTDLGRDADHGPVPGDVPDPTDSRGAPAPAFVRERLDAGDRLVLKPVFGGRGYGIRFCARDADGFLVDGERVADRAFDEAVEGLDGYLVCRFVEQAPYAADLYPHATNTIRLLTMADPGGGGPFLAMAVHRVGTSGSAPMDNCSQGGLSALIGPETGNLGPGRSIDPSAPRTHATHPDTGGPIEGVEISGWETVRDSVLGMAAELPYLPYLGWDVVVTGDGTFRVLELNNLVGIESLQVHEPLLADERRRAFYESHGVC